MTPIRYAACVAGLAAIFAAPSLAAAPGECMVAQKAATAATPPAGKPFRPSADTAHVMAEIDAMGGVGGAAPNAEAQAALDAITNLMAGRADADSQAAAAMMRKYASPPAPRPAAKKRMRTVPGC